MSFLTGVDRFLTVAKSSFENIKKYSTGENSQKFTWEATPKPEYFIGGADER